ncbi:hypothetical protein J4477_03425 [Candidatus Pacearchaeota archaeon]|nr:hypothetical protein [Candidatus Pacearchaeota archaeon]
MGKKKQIQKNEFFDINKFPAKEGMLIFGISMSQISNTQSATKCFSHIEELVKKIRYPYVGLTFLYSDNLYFYQKGDAVKLNKKFQQLMISHKNEFNKILNKNLWYIRDSFGFITWNQALIEIKDFMDYFSKLKEIYNKDKKFQKYLNDDIKESDKKINEENIMFILEEILVFYLASKGKLKFPNKYLNGKEKWVLWCYPGKPLKSEIYLYQKNFFNLQNKENDYENCYYDLDDKRLYDYSNVDFDQFKI